MFLLLVLCCCTPFAACSRTPTTNQNEKTVEINVAAAANLTDAFNELGKEFTKRTGIRVVFSFGATADLARQIENNAPFDVFASADVENVERLGKKGLLLDPVPKLYARGRLVVWSPPGARVSATTLEDLKRPEIERIGIAKPEIAPYGRASVEALVSQKLWPELEAKVIYGQNVLQVRQYASTGNIDVAFVPLALIKPGEGNFFLVDEQLYRPIHQAMGIVKASQKQEAAKSFVDLVLSQYGQDLLERSGYRKP